MEQKFSIVAALRYGFGVFFRNPIFFLVHDLLLVICGSIALTAMAGFMALSMIFESSIATIVAWGLNVFVAAALIAALFIGFKKGLLDLHDTGKKTKSIIEIPLALIPKVMLAGLPAIIFLNFLAAILVPFLVSFGMGNIVVYGLTLPFWFIGLLLIGGAYVTMRLRFVTFAMIDKKIGVVQAWRDSWRSTQHYQLQLFVLSLMRWSLLFLRGTGWWFILLLIIFISPLWLAEVWAYRKLEAQKNNL